MNRKRILVFIAAIVLLTVSIVLLSDDLFSPYVSFSYAQSHPGKYVQVMGKRDKNDEVKTDEQGFSFTMEDESGARLNVFHGGVKPLNFEHTEQVVVLGKFSKDSSIFMADRVLVKCPSKYERGGK